MAPDHPAVVKMNERAVATKAKADQRAQEQQRKDEEARAAAQRAEQERLDAIKVTAKSNAGASRSRSGGRGQRRSAWSGRRSCSAA